MPRGVKESSPKEGFLWEKKKSKEKLHFNFRSILQVHKGPAAWSLTALPWAVPKFSSVTHSDDKAEFYVSLTHEVP